MTPEHLISCRLATCTSLALAALLAACSSTPVAPPAAPMSATATPAPTVPMAPTAAAQPVAASTVASVSVPSYLDPASPIAKQRSVFFAFDDFSIQGDEAALVERHGKYLASNASLAIKVEGNSDERGSAEYNLALGQKRAEAVRRALQVYGAKDAQIEAVSWGEEKPKAAGHDEAAWAQNRRADIQYPAR